MFLKTGASLLVYLLHEEILDFFAVVITPVIHIKEFETFCETASILCFLTVYQTSLLLSLWVKFVRWFTFKLHDDEGQVPRHIAVNCDAHSRYDHLEQAYTTYGPQAACGPRKLFLRPARTFSIIENVAKARPRISNCRSRISSIPQRNLYIEMKQTFVARCKFMLIIWSCGL